MERVSSQDRPRYPEHCSQRPRVPSRSNTNSSTARMTSQSSNNSAINLAHTPTQRVAHPGPRTHGSGRRGSRGSIDDQPRFQLSKESTEGSRSSLHQVPESSFLLVKLQQERKSEMERSLSRMGIDSSSIADGRAAPSSPARCTTADGRRPGSSGENGDAIKQKGFGLKEMEQTMSSMHKQNFDLKLELFHRRARQTDLETRIEALESEKAQVELANKSLVQELEKRDRAVEEAVAMIISLETRMELLLKEREMVRQVESDNALYTQLNALVSGKDACTPKPCDIPKSNNNRNLAQMPSFISERTENTENLRNVYLGAQGSILSLSRTAEDRDPRGDNNGFASPSMSVLSESSFLSVYGQKAEAHKFLPSDVEGTAQVGEASQNKVTGSDTRYRSVSISSRNFTPTIRNDAMGAIETRSFTSPLERLEQLEISPSTMKDARRTMASGPDPKRSQTVRSRKQQTHSRSKQEKRDALHNVITDAPKHLPQMLPPTPDTASSSMINRGKNSDDALSHQDRKTEKTNLHRFSALTPESTTVDDSGHWQRLDTSPAAQAPSVTAFNGRKDVSGSNVFDSRPSIPQRPRSADESTISRHKNDWDSDSDSDDAASNASSFDPWLRESLKPGHQTKLQNGASVSQRNARRASPDLFSFPSCTKDWQANDMFGSLGGDGYLGSGAPLAPLLDALGDSLPTPETGLFGAGLGGPASGTIEAPPPPGRRSSLNANTSPSVPGTPKITRAGPERKTLQASVSAGSRRVTSLSSYRQTGSHCRQTSCSRGQTPNHSQQEQPPRAGTVPPKQRHYPPVASQPAPTRPRSRALGNLFRRSLGASPATNSPVATSLPAELPSVKKDSALTVGFPTWEKRGDLLDDDSCSATPPPIMRKRAPNNTEANDKGETRPKASPSNANSDTRPVAVIKSGCSGPRLGTGLNRVMAYHDGGAPLTPLEKSNEITPSNSSGQGKKNWFGFGRRTSGT